MKTIERHEIERKWRIITDGKHGGWAANLRNANLRDADLCNANLRGADLRNADLRDADLRDADLRGAENIMFATLCWPRHGEIGRQLLVVKIHDENIYFCGCFRGTESKLRRYIADGEARHFNSRTLALDTINSLMAFGDNDEMNTGGANDE